MCVRLYCGPVEYQFIQDIVGVHFIAVPSSTTGFTMTRPLLPNQSGFLLISSLGSVSLAMGWNSTLMGVRR
ncbi:MAG: hypothetical protein ACI9LZ_004043 [Glaciecola sp.]